MPRTSLYRHFDGDGRLLYVGISLCAISRLSAHMRQSLWRDDIRRIDVEWHPSRAHAIYAEAAAILGENPIYNAKRTPLDLIRTPDESDIEREAQKELEEDDDDDDCDEKEEEKEDPIEPPCGPSLFFRNKARGPITFAYTVVESDMSAEREMKAVASRIRRGNGEVQSDIGSPSWGVVCLLRNAQQPGTIVLTDRMDALAPAADLLAKRGIKLREVEFPR